MSFNQITIVGRLTSDPELRTTTGGKSVASFSVAVNWGKDSGTTFFRCQAWGNEAEFVTNYLGKGRLVLVSGRIQSRKFTDKSGNDRETYEVTAQEVKGLDNPKEKEVDPFQD